MPCMFSSLFATRVLHIEIVFFFSCLPLLVRFGFIFRQAHGIARLSPHYCRDSMRWLTLGTEEGVIWEKHVLQPQHPMFGSVDSEEDMESEDYSDATSGIVHVNEKLISWGLPPEHANLNPGFKCPFPADSTVTLDNPSYRFFNVSFMKGKLVSMQYGTKCPFDIFMNAWGECWLVNLLTPNDETRIFSFAQKHPAELILSLSLCFFFCFQHVTTWMVVTGLGIASEPDSYSNISGQYGLFSL